MKKAQQTGIQYLVLSLLAMYLVIAMAHVAFMPNLNLLNKHTTAGTELLHKNSNSGGNGSMYQRGVRCFIEQKRKTLVPVSPAFELFFSFIFGGLLALVLTQKPGSFTGPFQLLHPRAYLSLRSLRI